MLPHDRAHHSQSKPAYPPEEQHSRARPTLYQQPIPIIRLHKTYVLIRDIIRSTQKIKDRLVYFPRRTLRLRLAHQPRMENADGIHPRIIPISIALHAAAALSPHRDPRSIDMRVVALAGVLDRPVDGCALPLGPDAHASTATSWRSPGVGDALDCADGDGEGAVRSDLCEEGGEADAVLGAGAVGPGDDGEFCAHF